MVATHEHRSTVRSGYVLLVLLACSTLSYIDRQVISLVVGPIKASLGLSDTQIGLLQGLAFSLCYAVAGLPLALAVDRSHRVRLASGCILVWSLATSACGVANGFASFLAARAATAVSEAGFSPAALSILSDSVPPARVARVGAFYLLGPALGTGSALLLGGIVLQSLEARGGLHLPFFGLLAPWQGLFVCVGAPGLLLALLLLATVREPRRTAAGYASNPAASGERSLLAALRTTGDFIIPYVIGTTLLMLVQFAMSAWAPTFFVRAWGLAQHDVGKTLGPIFILMSILGALASGLLAKGSDGQKTLERVVALVIGGGLLLAPAATLMPTMPSLPLALTLYGLFAFSFSLVASLATAPMLLVMPSGVRGQSIAAGGFILAVVGAGGGPLAVGLVTDHVLGDERLIGASLTIVCGIAATLGLGIVLWARHILLRRWAVRVAAIES